VEEDNCMEALQLAGQIILENGGETFRAEETVCRMGEGFGLSEVESFAVPSGLFISYRAEDGHLETSVRRMHRKGTHLTRVDATNQVSRQAAAGQLAPEEALARLREIQSLRGPISTGFSLLAAGLCAGGFSCLFGGNQLEIGVSFLIATLVQGVTVGAAMLHDHGIGANILGGLMTSLLANLTLLIFPAIRVEILIASALMPMVPGVAMTNAVQDTLRGDMMSGLSCAAQALLTACLIAGGALVSPYLLRLILGGAA